MTLKEQIDKAFRSLKGCWMQKRLADPANADLLAAILNLYPGLARDEAVWLAYHNQTCAPNCLRCGQKIPFKCLKDGYNARFCSQSCGILGSLDKRKETLLLRYGDSKAFTFGSVKHKNAVKKKYGVDNVFQLETVKQTCKETMLQRYGVESWAQTDDGKRTIQENLTCPESREKARLTNIEKYGGQSPFSSRLVHEKSKQTLISKHGVGTAMAVPEVLEKALKTKKVNFQKNKLEKLKSIVTLISPDSEWENKNSSLQWSCSKCNMNFLSHLDDGKTPRCPKCFPYSYRKQQTEVSSFVKSLGVHVLEDTRSVIKPFEIDIWCAEQKVGIEFCGLFWHSETRKSDKNYHADKANRTELRGIKLIQIFSDEWETKREIVESKLRFALGKTQAISTRSTTLKQVKAIDAKSFFNATHLQGFTPGVHIGLYDGNAYIAMATFKKRRRGAELLRFSTILNTSVDDGLHKIVTHWKKENPEPLTTRCDRRWNDVESFIAAGFLKNDVKQPTCFYTNYSRRFSRASAGINILCSKKLYRIWDAGWFSLVYNETP